MNYKRTVTIDLFSGIGGFAKSSHEMGWESLIMCEIDPLCQVVLRHHFPQAYIHGDIHTLTWDIINEEIEKRLGKGWRDTTRLVCCGGFPCQPYSAAGKRLGKEDSRHLWPEMLRVIQECKPDAVVGENVSGILSWNGGLVFEEVQTDLEAQGFEVQAVVVPACAVGAPHRRDRVWFVGNARRKPGDGWEDHVTGEGEQHRARVCNGGEEANIIERPIEKGPATHAFSGCVGAGKNGAECEKSDGFGTPEDADSIGCNRIIAHPGHEQPQGRQSAKSRLQPHGRGKARGITSPLGGIRVAANPAVAGHEEREQAGGFQNPEEEGAGVEHEPERFGGGWDATNANGIGLRGQGDRQGVASFTRETCEGGFWANFPTEWPLRDGDDGLSERLGGVCVPGTGKRVTASSLNKFTLKAGGNAIVPQVALSIFRALVSTWEND